MGKSESKYWLSALLAQILIGHTMGLRQFSILALLGPFLGPHGCLKSYIGSSGDPVDPSGVPNGPRLTEHDPLLCILLWPGIGSFLGPQGPKKGLFWP